MAASIRQISLYVGEAWVVELCLGCMPRLLQPRHDFFLSRDLCDLGFGGFWFLSQKHNYRGTKAHESMPPTRISIFTHFCEKSSKNTIFLNSHAFVQHAMGARRGRILISMRCQISMRWVPPQAKIPISVIARLKNSACRLICSLRGGEKACALAGSAPRFCFAPKGSSVGINMPGHDEKTPRLSTFWRKDALSLHFLTRNEKEKENKGKENE